MILYKTVVLTEMKCSHMYVFFSWAHKGQALLSEKLKIQGSKNFNNPSGKDP